MVLWRPKMDGTAVVATNGHLADFYGKTAVDGVKFAGRLAGVG